MSQVQLSVNKKKTTVTTTWHEQLAVESRIPFINFVVFIMNGNVAGIATTKKALLLTSDLVYFKTVIDPYLVIPSKLTFKMYWF